MKAFLKRLFCWHSSWANAGWKLYSARLNENWYVCKDCGKLKNFGFENRGWLAMPILPVNFDCKYETYHTEYKIKTTGSRR